MRRAGVSVCVSTDRTHVKKKRGVTEELVAGEEENRHGEEREQDDGPGRGNR